MTLQSMTGFATREGGDARQTWRWELRSVNARGLDLRYRGPEGRDALEAAFREAAKARFARGSIAASLRLSRRDGAPAARLDAEALAAALDVARMAFAAIEEADMPAAPISVEAILAQRGVLDMSEPEPDEAERAAQDAAILADGEAALDALLEARREEGARLAAVLSERIDRIEELVAQARAAAEERDRAAGPMLRRKLDAVLEGARIDPDRLAAELALIAVKGDVREEIDRLTAHVAAARELLAAEGPIGRRFDFLTQEFNREANTLCSKADFTALTQIGLELKTVIDQMREQVQNVE